MWQRCHSLPDYKRKQIIAMIEQNSLDTVQSLPEGSFSHGSKENHCDYCVCRGDRLFDPHL
jgi:hypothetical protein